MFERLLEGVIFLRLWNYIILNGFGSVSYYVNVWHNIAGHSQRIWILVWQK